MLKPESISEIVRKAEYNYLHGTVHMGKYVNFKMHEVIDTIQAYTNNKHTSGPVDSLGREKPFFNIVTAAANIWMRATQIDRKDIKFVPTNSASIILAFLANVMLQKWMDENRFGQFLKRWEFTLSRYGSAVVEFIEKDRKLECSVIPWHFIIPDPIQFDNLPFIKKIYYTPEQLRKNTLYDQGAVNDLMDALVTRKTLDKQHKDRLADFIEVYEVHGELDTRLLEDAPDLMLENKDIKYRQQMHAVSMVQTGIDKKTRLPIWQDFTLYKGREKKMPEMITHLIEIDGRTLSIGAVEYLFEAQWMTNQEAKNMKDVTDLVSKLIFQTSDARFAGRNVLTAIEVGDIFTWDKTNGSPVEQINTARPDLTTVMEYMKLWQQQAQDVTSTPDALRGNTLPAGTAYATANALEQQGQSLFDVMTENKGLALEDMLREYIIPYIKKQLKNTNEIVAILDDAGVQEIDSMYIPHEAVRRHNQKVKNQLFDNVDAFLKGNPTQPIQPFNRAEAEGNLRSQLGQFGNKRFLKPDEIGQKTWNDILSDFEWDNIRVQVTNENTDTRAVLQTLSSILQTIASNPTVLQDPNARLIFNQILAETGRISPIQMTAAQSQFTPPSQPQLGQPQATPSPITPSSAVPSGGLPVNK